MEPFPGVPVRPGGVPRFRAGRAPVRGRTPGLPQRPRRPAAAGADDAPRLRRHRPRRRVDRALARGRPDRPRSLGPRRARPRRAPARPARGEPAGPAARDGRRPGAVQHAAHVRRGPARAQVVPALHDARIWRHPLVAAFDDTLRHDLVAAADTLPAVVDELEALPYGTAHGDACTRNLLVAADRPELVLIDFGFWGRALRVRPRPAAARRGAARRAVRGGAGRRRGRMPRRLCRRAARRRLRRRRRGGRAGARTGDAPVLRAAGAAVRAPGRRADPGADRHLSAAGGRSAVRPRPRRSDDPRPA